MDETASDNLALMLQNVEALYMHDANGRIVAVNTCEIDAPVVPRFFLGRTNRGNIWRFRHDVSIDLAEELSRYCSEEPFPVDLKTGPLHQGVYIQLLAEHTRTTSPDAGPIYSCSNDLVLPNSTAVIIDETTAHLLEDGMDDWLPDVPHMRPFMAIVEEERAVSVCASVRIIDSVHHAGVETLPQYRRSGYAVRAVAPWASAVRACGATPLYRTSWDNIASQNVARMLEMTTIGTDYAIT